MNTALRGEMLYDEPMTRHTTWRIGGPAQRFYRPADREDLLQFLRSLPVDEPLLWLGLGSNLLVRDGGIRGTVIATQGRLKDMQRMEVDQIYAEAGVACAHLARFTVKESLCGLEFLAGIPGTLGGALAMNAGAFGGETWKDLLWVESVDRTGQVRRRMRDEYQAEYRQVSGPAGEWFLAAAWQLRPGDAEAGQQAIKTLLEKRSASQPTQQPSCGSVFRNPPGDFAARLIETAGLKGHCIGDACVSDKHANFIINNGQAKAAEVEQLMGLVQQTVAERFGVRLRAEVHIVGEKA